MRTTCGVLLGLVLFAGGCGGPTMPAFGETDDLVLIIDRSAGEALRSELEAVFEAVEPWLVREPAFDVDYATPARFNDYSNWRNVILCGVWGGEVGAIVRDRVPGVPLSGEAAMTTATDIWAGRQVVGVIVAETEEQLLELLRTRGEELRTRFALEVRARLAVSLCQDAQSSGLKGALEDRFGWTICVPEDYELDTGAERDGFIRFDRRQPDRFVFVSWRPGGAANLTREYALAERDRLCSLYHNGDVIQEARPVLADTTEIAGTRALRLRGWWGNDELTGGGPFVAYCLHVPEDGRVYYLDASLFAPGQEKTPLIRHLDGILTTFRP